MKFDICQKIGQMMAKTRAENIHQLISTVIDCTLNRIVNYTTTINSRKCSIFTSSWPLAAGIIIQSFTVFPPIVFLCLKLSFYHSEVLNIFLAFLPINHCAIDFSIFPQMAIGQTTITNAM